MLNELLVHIFNLSPVTFCLSKENRSVFMQWRQHPLGTGSKMWCGVMYSIYHSTTEMARQNPAQQIVSIKLTVSKAWKRGNGWTI